MAVKEYNQTGQWLVIDDDTNRIIQVHDNQEKAKSNDYMYDVGSFVNGHSGQFRGEIALVGKVCSTGTIIRRGRYGPHGEGSPHYDIMCSHGKKSSFSQEFLSPGIGAGSD